MIRRLTLAGFVWLVALVLPAPSWAQANPLAALNGTWSGRGNIALSDGSRESISCRAAYDVPSGPNFTLALKCASDSYTFDFSARGIYGEGRISGNWDERTRYAAGTFSGTVNGSRIDARAEGPTFSALFTMTTHGNRQSISIRSPGSAMSEVTIVLGRR
jgi:hypothetical protein